MPDKISPLGKAAQPVIIEYLEFDALLKEELTLDNTIPQYVTDEGFSVSDAIINEPEALDMLLIVSELPVTWRNRSGHETSATRLSDALKKLEEMYYNKKPVTITTYERTYENMGIESLTISKDENNTGRTREIPISFKKIRVTRTATTEINLPSSNGKGGTTKNLKGGAGVTDKTSERLVSKKKQKREREQMEYGLKNFNSKHNRE